MAQITYSEYLQLRKGEPPPPDNHEGGVRVYADTDGTLHTLQSDGTDAEVGSGGGGSLTGSGAKVSAGADITGYAGGAIAYDAVFFDTDGFWDNGAKHFVIPAGKGGLYLISHRLNVTDTDPGETSVQIAVLDPDFGNVIYAPIAIEPGQDWAGVATALLEADEGREFEPQAIFDVSSSVTISCDGTDTGSSFALAYLGPLP